MSETMEDRGSRARGWWHNLQPSPERKGDRAALARLRRAAFPADAMTEQATLALFRRLGCSAAYDLPRVAVVAMVLAGVREDAPQERAIRAVGRRSPEDEESAVMSPLRLRRLLACREDEDLARQMRRLVALAGHRIDVADLARSLLRWDERTRTRWTFDYYAAGAAAPAADPGKAA